MRSVQNLLGTALAGAIAVIAVEAALLPLWIVFHLDYPPKLASDFIIEHTPPDNAIVLQNVLGPLAFPSAFLGGVMFVAAFGLTGGLAYALLRWRSRWAAIVAASLIVPAATWFCYPNMTPAALAPLLLVGLLTDRIARNDPPILDGNQGISRRQALARLAAFSLGGMVLGVIGGVPTYLSEARARVAGRRLFDYAPPAARVSGFDIPGLAPEVTPVVDFYIMRKFATPIPSVPDDWKLTIGGLVDHPLTLSLDDLLKMPRKDVYLTRQCVSNPVGGYLISTAYMSGVLLSDLLKQASVKSAVVDVVFYGRDGYSESVPLQYALDHGLLTYAMNGQFLPESHGAPLRLEVAGLYGFKNMKWLDRIEAVDRHVTAIWEQEGWTAQPVVKTMSRIDAVYPSPTGADIAGIAFAGLRGISAVEIQINTGSWQPATLNVPPLANQTWVQWRAETTQRGKLTVVVRAIDGEGSPQITADHKQFPDGASGLHSLTVTV